MTYVYSCMLAPIGYLALVGYFANQKVRRAFSHVQRPLFLRGVGYVYSHMHERLYASEGISQCFPWRCLHTTDDSHSELLRAAHRFGLAWYERIDVNGSDHVIQCKMSSSGSLRDSWKPTREFVRVTRVDFSYVPLALSLPSYSPFCMLEMLGRFPFLRDWSMSMNIHFQTMGRSRDSGYG